MENKYLAKILPFLNEIEEDRRKQFEEYFRTAPMWLMDTFVVEELEKAGWAVGVAWQDGKMFHGEYALRVNLALPFERVKEAFDRMDKYVF